MEMAEEGKGVLVRIDLEKNCGKNGEEFAANNMCEEEAGRIGIWTGEH